MHDATTTASDQLSAGIGWMRRHERQLLFGAVALQLLILLGMIAWQAMPIWTGETLLLRVQPIDPRDLMRGDYVILSYEMSSLPIDGVEGNRSEWADDRVVFVTLECEEDGVHWRGVKASLNKPAKGKYIQGKTLRGRLVFGIESYFLQEGTGKEYEEAIQKKKVSARISLTAEGLAALLDLQYDP
ncbi:MAG: GDYXXLXY domain-containing protein [Pirellulaceae bacterium]